jgi:hypothetical protein
VKMVRAMTFLPECTGVCDAICSRWLEVGEMWMSRWS